MQLRKHERSGLLSQIFSLHLERDEDGASPAVFPVLVRTCCLPVIQHLKPELHMWNVEPDHAGRCPK